EAIYFFLIKNKRNPSDVTEPLQIVIDHEPPAVIRQWSDYVRRKLDAQQAAMDKARKGKGASRKK
ncbi:hypothetical protein KIPB_014213, partial [Kipferlia bialata]